MCLKFNLIATLLVVLFIFHQLLFHRVFADEPVPEKAQEQKRLKDGDFVAMMGGSSTAAQGYSVFIDTYLIACKPGLNLRAMQFGSGNYGGSEGILSAASSPTGPLPFKPTIATMYFLKQPGSKDPEEYRSAAKRLIKRFKGAGAEWVALAVGVEDADLMEMAKKIALEEGGVFVDLPSTMNEVLSKAKAKYGEDCKLATSQSGWQLVVAYTFLKALGCDGNIGKITIDLSDEGKAGTTKGHKILSAKNGMIEIESSCYPFCFDGDPKSPQTTAGIIEHLPFNQELNRFMLVVKGSNAAKLKVTWGNSSKEFDSSVLQKGVNLAAEFLDNPFCEPLKKTINAVRDKEKLENLVFSEIGGTEESIKYLTKNISAEAAQHMQAIADIRVKEVHKRQDDLVAAIVPVKHMIKIEEILIRDDKK